MPVAEGYRISPDGAQVGYLVRDASGVELWVAPLRDRAAARALVAGGEPVTSFAWAYTNRHIVFERGGRVASVDLESGAIVELTPPGANAEAIHTLGHAMPEHVLIAGDVLYLVNIATGERVVAQQDAGFDGYYADSSLRARLAYRADGDARVLFHVARRGAWSELGGVSAVVGFADGGREALVLAGDALLSIDLSAGTIYDVAQDVTVALVHPRTGTLQAYAFGAADRAWRTTDDDVAATLRRVSLLLGGHVTVVDRTLDDGLWLVSDGHATYVFDRSTYALDPL